MPDAYFKLGQTYERLKQIDNAKKAYEAAVQKYPASFQATQARALQAQDRQLISDRFELNGVDYV